MHRWDVYRGHRTGIGRLPSIILFFAVFLFLVVAVLFFALPGYLVYTKDSVSLEIPWLQRDDTSSDASADDGYEIFVDTAIDTTATDNEDYSNVVAEIEVKNPDYSNLHLTTGEGLEVVQSVYVPYEYVNDSGINEAVSRAKALDVKGIILEVKDESGQLIWPSETTMATGYATGGTLNLEDTVTQLKGNGYYLTAEISVCVDNIIASRDSPVTLKDAAGFPYSDTNGAWLDPWNQDVRQYAIDLTAELMNMGFDEVVLNHCEHPTVDVQYSRTMSGTLTRYAAVTNFAKAVREGVADVMESTGAHLSVHMTSEALNNTDTYDNGQVLTYMLGVFDRVYAYTETYSEAQLFIDRKVDSTLRFVPIISWTFPSACWAENYFGT